MQAKEGIFQSYDDFFFHWNTVNGDLEGRVQATVKISRQKYLKTLPFPTSERSEASRKIILITKHNRQLSWRFRTWWRKWSDVFGITKKVDYQERKLVVSTFLSFAQKVLDAGEKSLK